MKRKSLKKREFKRGFFLTTKGTKSVCRRRFLKKYRNILKLKKVGCLSGEFLETKKFEK